MTEDIYKTVTVQQFKEYFFRDFPFLPFFEEGKTYWKDDIVYSLSLSPSSHETGWYGELTGDFYQSLIDDNTQPVTDTEAWKKVKGDIYNYVTDADIERAMSQAYLNRNSKFGIDDKTRIDIYLHLIAFYLVMDIQNAAGGVNSSYAGLVASKSVDGVSVSYNFPQWMINNPIYSIYSQNGYGMKYLSLILPYMSITVLFSRGRSTVG